MGHFHSALDTAPDRVPEDRQFLPLDLEIPFYVSGKESRGPGQFKLVLLSRDHPNAGRLAILVDEETWRRAERGQWVWVYLRGVEAEDPEGVSASSDQPEDPAETATRFERNVDLDQP